MNSNKINLSTIILLAALFLGSTVTVASAEEIPITFTDVTCLNVGSSVCSTTLYVYYPNGTLVGSLNSTADIVYVNSTVGLNFFLKPNAVSLLGNPTFALQWMISGWSMFFTVLFVFSMLIAMFFIIKRLFYGSGGTAAAPGSGGGNNSTWGKKRWG